MQRAVIVIIILPVLVLAAAAQAPAVPVASAEQQLLKLLNLERQRADLPQLEWNHQLAQAAEAHSRKLASHGGLSHQFPGEPELIDRVSVTGARFNALAENVAFAGDPEEAHTALMHSPGHRANILNPDYNAVGVAIIWVNNDMYVTEDFARLVPNYSADQFRDALITAFNRVRSRHRMGPIDVQSDAKLDRVACSSRVDPQLVLGLAGATQATVFTASEPGALPEPLEKAASDPSVKRMSIGLCFRTDPQDRISKFSVVTAFYRTSLASQGLR